jgi:hypothetical protein
LIIVDPGISILSLSPWHRKRIGQTVSRIIHSEESD